MSILQCLEGIRSVAFNHYRPDLARFSLPPGIGTVSVLLAERDAQLADDDLGACLVKPCLVGTGEGGETVHVRILNVLGFAGRCEDTVERWRDSLCGIEACDSNVHITIDWPD